MAYSIIAIVMVVLILISMDEGDKVLTKSLMINLGFDYIPSQNLYRRYDGDWVITVILESEFNPSIGIRKEITTGMFDPVESFLRFENKLTLYNLKSVLKVYNLKLKN